MDLKEQSFLIKDSLTQERICIIPDHILSFKNERLVDVARRFAWVDEDILRVITQEGIERNIKIDFIAEPVRFIE